MQSITFMAAFVVVILSSLGFILMGKDRSDADNRYFAAHDALTGLVNRRSLIMALERDVARAVRLREPYAVMLVDIDHFKFVNDSHGHLAGDSVLRHVADLLRTRLRAQDPVGRYGGEEFMVLLPHTPLGGALELAETLRRAVERLPCVGGGKEIPVTVSIGVAEAQLEAIFAPFTQQDASSTRRFGGLGLGLAITRRLTALMEGSLCLTSREGEGTDVWLSLPAEALSPPPPAGKETPGQPHGGPGA